MLRPTFDAKEKATSTILIEWFTTFGVVYTWIPDQGSHFKNKVVCEIKNKLLAHYHFTLPYCPWANGSVQVVYRGLLRQ